MPNNVVISLNSRLADTLKVLLKKEIRRLEREIDKRPLDFAIKGKDITMYKLQNYVDILNSFPKFSKRRLK